MRGWSIYFSRLFGSRRQDNVTLGEHSFSGGTYGGIDGMGFLWRMVPTFKEEVLFMLLVKIHSESHRIIIGFVLGL